MSPPSSRKRTVEADEDGVSSSKQPRREEEEERQAELQEEPRDAPVQRDGDSDDDDNDDEAPLAPRANNKKGKPAEVGIIKTVYVENFMCHRKLTCQLCPNVNFIHGQNGSGKSAILAAIQICLGAGARRTHRARNLAELIRKESNVGQAKISVTLRNEGEDGFYPELYGNAITVERVISNRSGAGGYKLINASTGKTVSTSKKDLDAMLDHLNIQVENPVAVLDQEEAKKFLTGKPEDKYRFFQTATELERLDRTYGDVADSVAELEANESHVEAGLQTSIQNVKRLKKEVEKFQELEILEDKIAESRLKQAWAVFGEVQKDKDMLESQYESLEKKLESRKAEWEKIQAEKSDDEERAAKELRLQELAKESEEASEVKRQLEQQLKLAQAPLKKLQRDSDQIQKEVQQAERRLQEAQAALRKAREEIEQRERESDQTKRLQALEKHQNDLAASQEQEKILRHEISTNLQRYQELEPQADDAKQRASNLERQMYSVDKKIKDLQSSAGNQVNLYGGPNAAKLATMVQKNTQAGKWNGPVVGPIGYYIKIAEGKERFAALAELATGNVLDRFIVTNDHDRKLFLDMRRKLGCQKECNLFQANLASGEVERYKIPPPPVDGIETVASCLTISNDLVFNVLVDQARIDQRAVGTSKEDTERFLLKTDQQGKQFIIGGNITEVFFLPNGDMWKCSKQGALNMRSNEKQMKRLIGADTRSAVKEAKEEHALLEREFQELKNVELEVSQQIREARGMWNEAKRKCREVGEQCENLQELIASIQAEIESAGQDEETDTNDLEEDVANAEQDLVVLSEKIEAIDRQMEDLQPQIEEAKQKVDEVQARNERVIAEMEVADKDLTTFMAESGERENKQKKALAKYEKTMEAIEAAAENLQEKRGQYEKSLRQARLLQFRHSRATTAKGNAASEDMPSTPEMTPEDPDDEELESIEIVAVKKDADYYNARVEQLKKRVEEEKRRRNITDTSYEEAFERYDRAFKDLRSKEKQLEAIKENILNLTNDLALRRKRWRQFQKHLVHMTKETFDETLQLKGSSGDLEFDHETKTLNLIVQKDNNNEQSQTKDVKALSGGERSFTTLSLLIALGERLETPFRVMDEFDVFLDPVSRKIALETLVFIAKKMEHRQFIFITPQDLSSITPDDKLKIFKMKPPARKDTVGGLAQQTLD